MEEAGLAAANVPLPADTSIGETSATEPPSSDNFNNEVVIELDEPVGSVSDPC